MKTSLEKHYKDREPLKTVQIIQKFFEDNHYQVKIEDFIESASGTYGYHLELYANDIECLTSNGKGVDADYALASAYAELYERFCNKNRIFGNSFFTSVLQNYNYEHYGYYLAADETEFENPRFLFPDENFQKYFEIYFNGKNKYLERFTSLICDNKLIGLPYRNIISNEIKYYNPNILLHLQTTNGMTAGNTLEEAINHGISEIIERWCIKLFAENTDKIYYALNLNEIENQELKHIIHKIKEDNNSIYILDLSYSFDFPVIGAILFNHKSKNIAVRFGCFPVFDIALERTLTELYQNISSWSKAEYTHHLQKPFKFSNSGEFIDQVCTSSIQNVFPEQIINNIEYIDNFNSKVFLSNKEYSNQEILEYLKNLCIEKNINFYMRDCSLINNMYAISMYSPELLTTTYLDLDFIKSISTKEKIKAFKAYSQLSKSFYENKKISQADLMLLPMSIETIQMLQLFSREHLIFLPFMEIDDFYFRVEVMHQLYLISQMKIEKDEEIMNLFNDTILKKSINKYLTLNRYISSNYPYDSIKKIFEKFGDRITVQDYININNPHYIFNQILIKPFNEYYNTNNILHILNGYFEEDL